MPFYLWSRTASANATADPTISFSEGMAPSSLNDSGRAMMARLADWRQDVSGTITSTGTSTAYAVASNQGFDTLAHLDGAMLAFIPHATNGTPATLNVDGLGAKPLRSSPGVEVGAGVLIQGTVYKCTYINADGAFYLQNFFGSAFVVPIGGMIPYLGSSAPNSNFVLPFGQAISRATYATLFSLISTTFGVGDGTTTFNIPDLRGRFIGGLGNMGGSDAGRITVAGGNFDGTVLGAVGGGQNHTLTTPEIPSHTHTATVTDPTHVHGQQQSAAGGSGFPSPGGGSPASSSSNTLAAATGITVANANTGGGGAHTILSPCMVLPFILRVI